MSGTPVAIGALINIVLIWMLDMRFFAHMLLGGIMSFFLGVMIFLIASLDNPMKGEVSVTPASYRLVYDGLMVWDEVGGDTNGSNFKICELEGMRWVQIEIPGGDGARRGRRPVLHAGRHQDARPSPRRRSARSSRRSRTRRSSARATAAPGRSISVSSLGGYYPFEVAGELLDPRERRLLGVGGWRAAGSVPRAGMDLALGGRGVRRLPDQS